MRLWLSPLLAAVHTVAAQQSAWGQCTFCIRRIIVGEKITDGILRWWERLVRSNLVSLGVLLFNLESLLLSMYPGNWGWYVTPISPASNAKSYFGNSYDSLDLEDHFVHQRHSKRNNTRRNHDKCSFWIIR